MFYQWNEISSKELKKFFVDKKNSYLLENFFSNVRHRCNFGRFLNMLDYDKIMMRVYKNGNSMSLRLKMNKIHLEDMVQDFY